MWGRDDVVAPWTHGTRLAREIGGARLEILECGHDPVLEKSQSFATLVSAFLDDDSSLPRDTRIAQPHAGSVPRLSIDRAR